MGDQSKDVARTKILVVDDDENIRILLDRILVEVGYDVLSATNGREALDKLGQGAVDLVLLDLRMPVLDGFETLKLIRLGSEIPVIILTGVGDRTTLLNTLGLGADDYVTKPFGKAILLARIHAKLRRIR